MTRDQLEQALDRAIEQRERARKCYAAAEVGSAERLEAVAQVAEWSGRVNLLLCELTGEVRFR